MLMFGGREEAKPWNLEFCAFLLLVEKFGSEKSVKPFDSSGLENIEPVSPESLICVMLCQDMTV